MGIKDVKKMSSAKQEEIIKETLKDMEDVLRDKRRGVILFSLMKNEASGDPEGNNEFDFTTLAAKNVSAYAIAATCITGIKNCGMPMELVKAMIKSVSDKE